MKKLLLFLLFFFSLTSSALAQYDTSLARRRAEMADQSEKDSIFRARMEESAVRANHRLRERYLEQVATTKQSQLFASLRAVYQRTRDYLKRGVDSTRISDQLNDTERKIDIAGDGIFINQGSIQTARNIATSGILLQELSNRNRTTGKEIDQYLTDLDEFRNTIDSLASDSLLFHLPSDSVEIVAYLQKLLAFQIEVRHTDSLLNTSIKAMRSLNHKAEILGGNIASRMEDMENFHNSISDNSLGKEVTYFWEKPPVARPLREIIRFSMEKTNLVFVFYLKNHAGKFFVLLVALLMLTAFLRSLKKNIVSVMGQEEKLSERMTIEHPFQVSLLIVISIGQFIFPDPPFSFYALAWFISFLALAFILWTHISNHWKSIWVISMIHFAIACLFNFILQASRTERYAMLAFGISSIYFGYRFLRSDRIHQLQDRRVVVFVWIYLVMEITAVICNIGGRYNLGKSMLTSGHFNLIVGMQLLWTIRFLHEIFSLAAEAYREENKRRFYIDFNRLSKDLPTYLFYILGLGWFLLVGRNFYVYRQVTDPIMDFFKVERTIGAYSFSFGSILLFIFIIVISAVCAKVVSYFVDNGSQSSNGKRSGLSNWTLLIRIAIISLGLFLAFAATGIPLDRVAIVFGALSVGIGFGLQNLVNNLVSGLIIAFEKPLNVGDIVEVGGQTGTMKSIGFRSSVISTFDGSDVVIPNGELLNQHLINWTLNTTSRRVEILVGVNYNTDIDKTIDLIKGLMQADARINSIPEPVVLVKEFSNSSIDLRVLFWVDNRDNWPGVRSDLMRNIKSSFDKHDIEIPYPQMVLHQSATPSDDPAIIDAGKARLKQ